MRLDILKSEMPTKTGVSFFKMPHILHRKSSTCQHALQIPQRFSASALHNFEAETMWVCSQFQIEFDVGA